MTAVFESDSPPDRHEQLESGEVKIWHLDPSTMLAACSGYLDMAIARIMQEEADRLQPPMRIFHDWFGVTGYQPTSQVSLTSYVAKNRTKFEIAVIGTTAPLVKAGIGLANVPLRGLLEVVVEPVGFKDRMASVLKRSVE